MFSFVSQDIDFAHKLDNPSSPTEEYYKHIHTFNEILMLVHGNVDYTVESESHRLNDGDIVFIPSGKYHFATVDLSVKYERYVCKFPDSFIPEYMRKKLTSGSVFFFNSKKYSVLFNRLDSYYEQFTDEEIYTLFRCEIIKTMVMLCHDVQPALKHNDFFDLIIEYIDSNLQQRITAETLSEEFHYSKSFINNEFKRHMKIPLQQYIRSKKIIAAHQMILSGMKKNEAAEMFGFETYSTFYRAYKKLIEQTVVSHKLD